MQTIDEEKKKEVITFLEQVKKRTLMYIGKPDADLMACFLWAFNFGCLLMRSDDGREGIKMSAMRDEYIRERGWRNGSRGLVVEVRKKGLSEEEIIQGLVEIEIEIWKNL
jgi:hypothetical protein